MNSERLAEVARIIEKLAPRQDVEDELMIRVNMQRLVTSPERHASITHLHMGVYHGTEKCGSVGCIAGVTIQHWPDEAKKHVELFEGMWFADDVAARILELTTEAGDALFHCTVEDGHTVLGNVLPDEAAAACRRLAAGAPLNEIWKKNATPAKEGR